MGSLRLCSSFELWIRTGCAHWWVGGDGSPSLLHPPCCALPWQVGMPLCPPPHFRSPPHACLPTLADAVSSTSRATQLETGLAAAVPGPLHLCAAGRTAEGRVISLALWGSCGEKTSQDQPLSPGPLEWLGSQKENSLCRRRKEGGRFIKTPVDSPPRVRGTHSSQARQRVKVSETASLFRKA